MFASSTYLQHLRQKAAEAILQTCGIESKLRTCKRLRKLSPSACSPLLLEFNDESAVSHLLTNHRLLACHPLLTNSKVRPARSRMQRELFKHSPNKNQLKPSSLTCEPKITASSATCSDVMRIPDGCKTVIRKPTTSSVSYETSSKASPMIIPVPPNFNTKSYLKNPMTNHTSTHSNNHVTAYNQRATNVPAAMVPVDLDEDEMARTEANQSDIATNYFRENVTDVSETKICEANNEIPTTPPIYCSTDTTVNNNVLPPLPIPGTSLQMAPKPPSTNICMSKSAPVTPEKSRHLPMYALPDSIDLHAPRMVSTYTDETQIKLRQRCCTNNPYNEVKSVPYNKLPASHNAGFIPVGPQPFDTTLNSLLGDPPVMITSDKTVSATTEKLLMTKINYFPSKSPKPVRQKKRNTIFNERVPHISQNVPLLFPQHSPTQVVRPLQLQPRTTMNPFHLAPSQAQPPPLMDQTIDAITWKSIASMLVSTIIPILIA